MNIFRHSIGLDWSIPVSMPMWENKIEKIASRSKGVDQAERELRQYRAGPRPGKIIETPAHEFIIRARSPSSDSRVQPLPYT